MTPGGSAKAAQTREIGLATLVDVRKLLLRAEGEGREVGHGGVGQGRHLAIGPVHGRRNARVAAGVQWSHGGGVLPLVDPGHTSP